MGKRSELTPFGRQVKIRLHRIRKRLRDKERERE